MSAANPNEAPGVNALGFGAPRLNPTYSLRIPNPL